MPYLGIYAYNVLFLFAHDDHERNHKGDRETDKAERQIMKYTTPPLPPNQHVQTNSRPVVQFEWTDWLPYLDDSDIPDAQKQEWIETLWAIVLGFVDLGFEVKATPQICGEDIDLKAVLRRAVLNSEDAASRPTNAPASQEDIHER